MIAILHNIRSLYNVGSIFRTSDAAGVEKIYLCGITPKPIDQFGRLRPQLTKVSLGAEKTVPWEHCQSTSRLIDELKKDGYAIFSVEQDKKSIPYYRIKYHVSSIKKAAIVFGNEVRGIPLSILKKSDKILEIPMRGAMVRDTHHPRHSGRGKESLNVGVTAGIVLFSMLT